MVKIVGQDQTVAKRIICRNCGSVLEYLPVEVKKYSGHDYSGGSDGREWIVCPQCSHDVTIRSW